MVYLLSVGAHSNVRKRRHCKWQSHPKFKVRTDKALSGNTTYKKGRRIEAPNRVRRQQLP